MIDWELSISDSLLKYPIFHKNISSLNRDQLFDILESNFEKYNRPDFIEEDPISIPHSFSIRQDIEISGLFAATLAWGQRKTIINKTKELMTLMDRSPYQFVLLHTENDLKPLISFKHRTFNATDLLYFIHFLKRYYSSHNSLEDLFYVKETDNTEQGLNQFYQHFISDEFFPARTKKHVASPMKKSACKRLCMYLRWMVRRDDHGVDFGIWKRIKPSQLICPCDVHVEKVARSLGLINRKQVNWQMAVDLTDQLKKFDANDPVKYDFALFGMGMNQDH